jgi:hypothetical protein
MIDQKDECGCKEPHCIYTENTLLEEIKQLKANLVKMRLLLIRCHWSNESGLLLSAHSPLDNCQCEIGQIVRATEGYHE